MSSCSQTIILSDNLMFCISMPHMIPAYYLYSNIATSIPSAFCVFFSQSLHVLLIVAIFQCIVGKYLCSQTKIILCLHSIAELVHIYFCVRHNLQCAVAVANITCNEKMIQLLDTINHFISKSQGLFALRIIFLLQKRH